MVNCSVIILVGTVKIWIIIAELKLSLVSGFKKWTV